jgi:hypothetical protein
MYDRFKQLVRQGYEKCGLSPMTGAFFNRHSSMATKCCPLTAACFGMGLGLHADTVLDYLTLVRRFKPEWVAGFIWAIDGVPPSPIQPGNWRAGYRVGWEVKQDLGL